MPSPPVAMATMVTNVVSAAPSSVTNITGLRAIARGSSIVNDWPTAGPSMSAVNSAAEGCADIPRLAAKRCDGLGELIRIETMIQRTVKCSAIGPSMATGRKRSAPTIRTVPVSTTPNRGVSVGRFPPIQESAAWRRATDDRQRRDDRNESAQEHDHAGRDVPWDGVVTQPFEARTVVRRAPLNS